MWMDVISLMDSQFSNVRKDNSLKVKIINSFQITWSYVYREIMFNLILKMVGVKFAQGFDINFFFGNFVFIMNYFYDIVFLVQIY